MWLDVRSAITAYVERILSVPGGDTHQYKDNLMILNQLDSDGDGVKGMKVLVVDKETVGIISSVVTQSFLLEREVYLTSYIVESTKNCGLERTVGIPGLTCIIFVRSSPESIEGLVRELSDPAYSAYHLHFSSPLRNAQLERLAAADVFGVVQSVREAYADYYVHSSMHASVLPIAQDGDGDTAMGLQMGAWNPKALGRSADGLAAILAGLKRIPIVRYDSGSSMASRLAHELRDILEERKESMFPESYNFSSPVLLILDRRADLVTPLLTPWTYESLVHELFKIRNGRVSLTNKNKNIELNNDIANKQGYEKNDHVLSETQDSFYKDHIDASFGELGEAVRNIVQELQSQTSRHKESIGGSERSTAAVRKFLAEDYGDFKRLSGIVSRHVSIVGEISHRVDSDRLLYFSEIEQAIAAFEGSTPNMTIKKLLSDVLVSYNNDAALRILLIYCLRFRTTSNDPFLSSLHISSEFKTIVDFAITYSTPVDSSESPKMLGLYSFCGRGSVIVSGKDTSNVYMRHIPPLLDVVDALVRGRLSPITFPALSPTKGGGILLEPMQNPQEVIVFFVNGSTYHEAHYLRMYCKANPAISVVLAGTSPTTTNDILNEFRRQSVKPSE